MTNSTLNSLIMPAQQGKQFFINFNGGSITNDAGLPLLRLSDEKQNLLESVASKMTDKRDLSKIKHTLLDMLRQRVYGIAAGYEDGNDHNHLRKDELFQLSVGTDSSLASGPTLSRFENCVESDIVTKVHDVILDTFIKSFETAPEKLILDFDATDDTVHGMQENRHFNGYYDDYCFLPLYVFCGKKLLTGLLLPSNQDPAKSADEVLRSLVTALRKVWPDVKILFRADSGFCRPYILQWCESNNVNYIVGLPGNKVLTRKLAPLIEEVEIRYKATNVKQLLFSTFRYKAHSWNKERKVVGKADYSDKGPNHRFIITDLEGTSKELYQETYCARGDMENRIKEQQSHLFADRTSCHEWYPNQFRLLLSALAYMLIEYIRANALVNTPLETAQADTIRLKLFKIAALIRVKSRRIYLSITSYYPYESIFRIAFERLVTRHERPVPT